MNQQREAISASLLEYLKSVGETASLDAFTVTNLNSNTVLLKGAAVTEQAAQFLRSNGFTVFRSGEMAVAKKAKKKKSNRGGDNVGNISELHYFNDDKSIRVAKKMYEELVEAKDWRYFPQFLQEIDRVIANARVREGHPMDDEEDDSDSENAPIVQNEGRRAIAEVEVIESEQPNTPIEAKEPE